MSNNTTNDCYYDQSTLETVDRFYYSIYYVLTPIYLIVGLSTNALLLVAFYIQSKTEKAYGYQVVFTVCKTLETYSFGTFLLCGKWFYLGNLEWFITSYGLMKYLAVFLGFHMSFIISSLLFSIAMSADRIFALVKPAAYKNINKLKHQIVASVICFALGFLGGSMYFFDMHVLKTDGPQYALFFDNDLEHSVVGQICFFYRLLGRVGGVCILIVLNSIMIVSFRKRRKKVAAMTAGQQSRSDQKQAIAEKTLLWVNIYQACMMILNQFPHVTWQVLLYAMPEIENCEGLFVGPIADGMLMLTDTVNFFVMMILNKRTRDLVLRVLPRCCHIWVRDDEEMTFSVGPTDPRKASRDTLGTKA